MVVVLQFPDTIPGPDFKKQFEELLTGLHPRHEPQKISQYLCEGPLRGICFPWKDRVKDLGRIQGPQEDEC